MPRPPKTPPAPKFRNRPDNDDEDEEKESEKVALTKAEKKRQRQTSMQSEEFMAQKNGKKKRKTGPTSTEAASFFADL